MVCTLGARSAPTPCPTEAPAVTGHDVHDAHEAYAGAVREPANADIEMGLVDQAELGVDHQQAPRPTRSTRRSRS
jgi:hypothetical protein